MVFSRSSGILLHPTSLPGSPGIGTLGQHAYTFIDWLQAAGQSIWQILPIGPTGYGDSPYASFSTFAGNPLLIDLDLLAQNNYLSNAEIIPPDYIKTNNSIDYGSVVWWKLPVLKKAALNFLESHELNDFEQFKRKEYSWLKDYAVFMSIKQFYDQKALKENLFGKLWNNYWPKELATNDKQAIKEWEESHTKEIEIHMVIQYFFFSQWQSLKKYANEKGISIIGDIPIFVASDSVDVWANQRLFQLNEDGTSKVVAGVPPDYFSATGQLWGNPLYDWAEMKKDGYSWWLSRIKHTLSLVDYIRVDHFRGFEAYWAVSAKDKTAEHGKWVKGPDHNFFEAIQRALGDLPILAEDLGLITPEVQRLRDDFHFPGMKVLQFAFDTEEAGKDGCTNAFLPHMYTSNNVVYTGTHDNDTMQGWLDKATTEEITLIQDYLGVTSNVNLVPELIRLAMQSVAIFAIFPLQDIYALGSEARINTPSTLGNNWVWRMDSSHFNSDKASWLKSMSKLYARNLNMINRDRK